MFGQLSMLADGCAGSGSSRTTRMATASIDMIRPADVCCSSAIVQPSCFHHHCRLENSGQKLNRTLRTILGPVGGFSRTESRPDAGRLLSERQDSDNFNHSVKGIGELSPRALGSFVGF